MSDQTTPKKAKGTYEPLKRKPDTEFAYHNYERFFSMYVFETRPAYDYFTTKPKNEGDPVVTKYCHLMGLQDMENGHVLYAQQITESPVFDIEPQTDLYIRFSSYTKGIYNVRELKIGDAVKKVEVVVPIPAEIERNLVEEKEQLHANGLAEDNLNLRTIALNASIEFFKNRNINFENVQMTPIEYVLLEADIIKEWLMKRG